MEDGDEPPFYWDSRRRKPPLISPSFAVILVPCLAFLCLFLLLKSPYNPPPQYYYPNPIPNPPPRPKPAYSFRRSWDSLNVLLILAAILAGVFARRTEDSPPPPDGQDAGFAIKRNQFDAQFPQVHQQQHQWLQPAGNRRIAGFSPRRSGGGGLRRASSAYPDFMREEANLWEESLSADRRFRFFDDFEINNYYPQTETTFAPNREEEVAADPPVEIIGEIEIKEIPVDIIEESTQDPNTKIPEISEISPSPSPPRSPPPQVSPAPPPPPPPVRRSKPRRSHQSVPRMENTPVEEPAPAPPAPVPPPPPPTPPRPATLRQAEKKLKRRKSNATKEFAMALASLYNNRKRKRKLKPNRQEQDLDDTDQIQTQKQTQTHQYQHRFPPPSPPPPPPPLPPPPSVFHNFFKKTSKLKKIHSVSDPPRRSTKPPLPTPRSINGGSQSPLIPVPPPPPFRIPAMKFAVVSGGDFVRVRSAQSSRVGSPEEEEGDLTGTIDVDASGPSDEAGSNGGDSGGPGPAFGWPSPDVNVKADTFIARLHDGWKLEKLNSWRERQK